MAGGDVDGDDDDFQNPRQAALRQSLMLSSLKSRLSQPLKPSNGYRPRKRPRPSAANGKENVCMLKNLIPDSRVSKDCEESNQRNELCNEIIPVGSGKIDVDLECVEEDGVVDLKSNFSPLGISRFVDRWPCDEGRFRNESQFVESNLLKSAVSVSSIFDLDCSNLCTFNDEQISHVRSSCDSGKSVVMRETLSTLEMEACLASTDLGLAGDLPRRAMEGEILNYVVGCGTKEDKSEISSQGKILESEDKSILSGCREYSSGIDNELKLMKQFNDQMVQEKCPIREMKFVSFESYQAGFVLPDKQKLDPVDMSIEAKLLNPCRKLVPHTISCRGEEIGAIDEFESGSQFNILMDLCCKTREQGDSVHRTSSLEQFKLGEESMSSEMSLLVQCPICQTDLSNMSEEMRHIHTNDCLDKDAINAANSCKQALDTNRVLEWLRTLDLCRYEEAFIREEIDWDTLQSLTEEDLISIGIVALGPRKKIVHALNDLRQRNFVSQEGENVSSNEPSNENKYLALTGNKLITEYFHGSVSYKTRGCNPFPLCRNVENARKGSIQKKVGNKRSTNRGRVGEIPPWCCIAGTPFRVDAFRYLRGDCSHWFLTHFHMDHYQGLTKNFCHGKVYCSKITAHLVHMKIGVPWDKIQILPLNEKISIAGINLTCLDANHCPGSIIILFEPSNKKAVLHTGDFRFSAEMAASAILQSCQVHTLILDTTYCNPQYDFPKQEEVIQFVIDAIQAEAFNPKTLFLIGTYTIGKEKLFLEVARTLRRKLYVVAAKLHLLQCLGLSEEDMQLFTANEMESHVHVVPMWTIASFKRMKYISNQYSDRYNLIVSFSPTGWTCGKGKKKTPGRRWQQGTIIRYEVPYSEHCSFTELKEFVRFISPEIIIPSVNNKGLESVDAMLNLLLSDS